MSAIFDPSKLATLKFGVGQPVRRTEDPILLRGEGRYTDDLNQPGQLYATIVRSREAHGFIRSIDVEAAKAMPGVRGVYTAKDTWQALGSPRGQANGEPNDKTRNASGKALAAVNRKGLLRLA